MKRKCSTVDSSSHPVLIFCHPGTKIYKTQNRFIKPFTKTLENPGTTQIFKFQELISTLT